MKKRFNVTTANEWWDTCDFKTMEIVSGYRQDDFSPEDGYQDFVDTCNNWWDSLEDDEKIRIAKTN